MASATFWKPATLAPTTKEGMAVSEYSFPVSQHVLSVTSAAFNQPVDVKLTACLHDLLELAINFLRGPAVSLRVLSHLETGNSNTTSVGGFTRGVEADTLGVVGRLGGCSGCLEDVDSLLGGTHVGTLGNVSDTGHDQSLGLLARNLVLGSTGKCNIGLGNQCPGPLTLVPFVVGSSVKGGERLSLKFEVGNLGNVLGGETGFGGGDQRSGRVGEGKDFTAKLDDLEGSVLGDVSGTREEDLLALPVGVVEVSKHLGDVVD
jgi:hypothetical protein